MAELKRASVFALKKETSSGTLIAPASAAEFIPLRADHGQEATLEEIETDELLNDIGASEPTVGKETPSGSHSMYIKHSGVEGQEPEAGLLIESCLGDKTVNATEYNTVSGSTTTVVNVDTGEGASFEEGQALLIKDGTNGYSIRNVESIATDALTLNFAVATAPGTAVELGKAILYKPAASGHPTYSAWLYHANAGAKSAISGCQTSSLSVELPAGQPVSCSVSYEGTSAFHNPFIIDATNNKCNMTDDVGTVTATLTSGSYKTPVALATEIATQLTAASLASGADAISCSYDSVTGKYTIASDGSVLSLLWKTGVAGADGTDTHFGTIIGFSDAADDASALTYTSDSAIDLSAPYTPTYDDEDVIIAKNAELMIGSATENICRQANNISITIDRPSADVDDICAESGVSEKIAESRTATMTATLILKRYESSLFDKLLNSTDVSVMVNAGKKDSSGNWTAAKNFNFFMQKAKITSHTVGGDSYVTVELNAKGFVTSTKKDCYLNFI